MHHDPWDTNNTPNSWLPFRVHVNQPWHCISRDQGQTQCQQSTLCKIVGSEHNKINIGKFVCAWPPTSKPSTRWAHGCVTEECHSQSHNIKMPSSTTWRHWIHNRGAAPLPSTPHYTHACTRTQPCASLQSKRSALNMPTDKPNTAATSLVRHK